MIPTYRYLSTTHHHTLTKQFNKHTRHTQHSIFPHTHTLALDDLDGPLVIITVSAVALHLTGVIKGTFHIKLCEGKVTYRVPLDAQLRLKDHLFAVYEALHMVTLTVCIIYDTLGLPIDAQLRLMCTPWCSVLCIMYMWKQSVSTCFVTGV